MRLHFIEISISYPIAYRAAEDEPSLSNWDPQNPNSHVYSRYTQNVSTRVEKVIGALHVSSSQM